MKAIDLGKAPSKDAKVAMTDKDEPYFPSAHLSELKGVDFEVGDEVTLQGKIQSVTINDRGDGETYSCEVKLTKLIPSGKSEGLSKALDKIKKKKVEDSEEDY